MKNKALLVSILMAVVGFFISLQVMEQHEEDVKKRFGNEAVVLKTVRPVGAMTTLDDSMIIETVVPEAYLEPGAVRVKVVNGNVDKAREEMVKNRKEVIGMVTLISLSKGEQITRSKISEPDVRTGLSGQVTPGKRAVTIPVNDNTAVGKLLKPGDHVDVLVVSDDGSGKANRMIRTLLQDIPILAVGQMITNQLARKVEKDPTTGQMKVKNLTENTSYSNVTLEVDPAAAQTLVLLTAEQIYLSLRHHDDIGMNPALTPVRLRDLMGDGRQPASGGGR